MSAASDMYNKTDISGDMKYALKKSAVASRSYRYSLRPDAGSTFSPSDTVRFTIPTRRKNTFLVNHNCYLKFKVATTAAVNFDSSAASCIQRVEEFSSGNLLSSIDNYGALFDILFHSKISQSAEMAYDVFMGVASKSYQATGPVVSAVASVTLNDHIGSGEAIAENGSTTVCVPIMSPVVGVLAESDLPVWAIDDLRLELTLASVTNAFYSAGAPTITYSDVSFEMEFTELSNDGMNLVSQYIDDDIVLHANSFRSYTGTIAANSTGQQTHLINAKYSSLKTIYTLYQNYTNTQGAYSTNSRVKNIDSYQLRVGSALVPSKPLTTTQEMFLSSQLAVHNTMSSMLSRGSTNKSRYSVAHGSNTGNSSYKNDFYIAVKLDNLTEDALLLSGINTIGENAFSEVNINPASAESLFVVNYAEFDCIFVVKNGVMTVRF